MFHQTFCRCSPQYVNSQKPTVSEETTAFQNYIYPSYPVRKNNRLSFTAPFPTITLMPSSSPHSKSDFLAGDNPVSFLCTHLSSLADMNIWRLLFCLCIGHASYFPSVFGSGCTCFSDWYLMGFFSPSYTPLSSLLFCFCFSSSFWLFLLPFCSASGYSPCHVSFFPTCLLSSLHSTELRLKTSFLPPLLAFPKRSFCGASLGTTALCFLFVFILLTSKLFLSLSFPRISSKHLSSARHWLPSTCLPFHQAPVGLLILFSLPVPCSCIPAHLHSAVGKGGSGKIGSFTCTALTCWRRYLSPLGSEVRNLLGQVPSSSCWDSLPSSFLMDQDCAGQTKEQVRQQSRPLWGSHSR